jgi:hypothetical protein
MAIGTGAGTMTGIVTEIGKGRERGRGKEIVMGGKTVIAREIAMMIGTGAGIGGTRVKRVRRNESPVLFLTLI